MGFYIERKKLLLKLIDNFINLINQELPTKADIGNQKARVRKSLSNKAEQNSSVL